VTVHVLDLANLRDEARGSAQGTQERWQRWQRYWRARDESPLRDYFSSREIDDMTATVRELVEAKCWGLLVPMNSQGTGYGRQKARARAMAPKTVDLVVADLVSMLASEPDRAELEAEAQWRSCMHCDARPGEDCDGDRMHAARLKPTDEDPDAVRRERQRVRKARQRVRELLRA